MKIQFDNVADEYARFRSSDPNAVERLVLGSGISSTSRVLEIGCGTGNYISALQERVGCECSGIDPSQAMIEHAQKRNSRVAFSVGSAENLDFADASFDFLFSVDVVHHVDDLISYFREASRVLKPSGLLATLTDSEDTIRNRVPLSFYFPEIVEHELKRYPALGELRQHSREAGFQVVGEEVIETQFTLNDVERYRSKAFSCLRLISEESFVAGLERMSRDLEAGPIHCVSRKFALWNRK